MELSLWAIKGRKPLDEVEDLPQRGQLIRTDSGVLCRCLAWFDVSPDQNSPSCASRVALVRIIESPNERKIPVGSLGICPEDECRPVSEH
jgi:hypothetical protein